MLKEIPIWFWVSLFIFCIIQLVNVPILATFTNSSAQVATGILFYFFFVYPIFFAIMFILLKKKKEFNIEEMVVPTAFLLMPPLLYIPLFTN